MVKKLKPDCRQKGRREDYPARQANSFLLPLQVSTFWCHETVTALNWSEWSVRSYSQHLLIEVTRSSLFIDINLTRISLQCVTSSRYRHFICLKYCKSLFQWMKTANWILHFAIIWVVPNSFAYYSWSQPFSLQTNSIQTLIVSNWLRNQLRNNHNRFY